MPAWLYPTAYWIAVALLAAVLLLPQLALVGVGWMMAVPVLAGLTVAVLAWRRGDRLLATSALVALVSIALIFALRGVLSSS
nr:hypothetical protein [Deinobacterium chartae]